MGSIINEKTYSLNNQVFIHQFIAKCLIFEIIISNERPVFELN
jgi:hypothetical protein